MLLKHAEYSEVHLHRGVTQIAAPLEKDGPIISPHTNVCFRLSNYGLPRVTSVCLSPVLKEVRITADEPGLSVGRLLQSCCTLWWLQTFQISD